ncbi:MAG: ECF transporter S component [Clostridiales bacterium]|nr:ECF transporter S component [Clostridiales bacterium]
MNETTRTSFASRKATLKTITKIALLAAVSTVLMLFEFPLWFAPPFYKIDLSEVAVLIGGFALGPVAGAVIELIKVLLNLLIDGTMTGGIGEFANFVVGCSLVLPAAAIYRHRRTFKSAVIGMMAGTVSLTIVGSAMNYFLLLPVYARVYGIPIEALIEMGTAVNKSITDLKSFVLLAVAPFNFVKGVITSILTVLLYKRVSSILQR